MQTETNKPITAARPDQTPTTGRSALSTQHSALSTELAWLAHGLRTPGLYLCLAGALILWLLAWQVKPAYHLEIGGPEDNAYVGGDFYAKEPDPQVNPHPEFTYRWSRADSDIVWPGLGNLPVTVTLRLASGRPAGALPLAVTVTARGQRFPLTVEGGLRDYSFVVDRGNAWDGDLAIAIHAPTFTPPGDGRALGVLVAGVTLTPLDSGPRLAVIPPPADLARWAAALVLCWLLAWRLSGATSLANLAGSAVALGVGWGAVAIRPSLGLLAPEVPVLLLWAYPLALLARELAGAALRGIELPSVRFPRQRGAFVTSLSAREDGWGLRRAGPTEAVAGALVVGFLLRVGGMVYPQFLSSDILLHVHNIQKVLNGVWVWTGTLPNGAPQPYPPLPYLALAPFAWLVPDLTLLLKFGVGLLDAACVLPLFYLGARLGGAAAGAWAGWVYALLPAPFLLFSPGVFAYLFAACVFTWTLAVWGDTLLVARPGAGRWAVLGLGFFLTFLSAYGMLIAAVSVAAVFVMLAILLGPADIRRRALGVAGMLALAGAAAFAVYYVHFADILLAPARGVSSNVVPPAAPVAALLDLLGRRLGTDLGWVALLAALAGWAGMAGRARGMGLLVAGTALAGLGFAALSLVAGENIRYPLLFAPLVAVGAGLLLSRMAASGRAGRGWSVVVLGLLFWHLLEIWVPLVMTRYH